MYFGNNCVPMDYCRIKSEKYQTNSYNKVLEWIFQNTNELQNKKTEDQDQKSLSSVSVHRTGCSQHQTAGAFRGNNPQRCAKRGNCINR